jgi:hypothetical protein
MPAVSMSLGAIALHGVPPSSLRGHTILPDLVMQAMRGWLDEFHFDVHHPITVRELPNGQGFTLSQ